MRAPHRHARACSRHCACPAGTARARCACGHRKGRRALEWRSQGVCIMSAAKSQARVELLDLPDDRGEQAAARTAPAVVPRTWAERLRLPLMLIAPLVVIAAAVYFYFTGGRYQSTDDAYVEAGQGGIRSNISGRGSEIGVND